MALDMFGNMGECLLCFPAIIMHHIVLGLQKMTVCEGEFWQWVHIMQNQAVTQKQSHPDLQRLKLSISKCLMETVLVPTVLMYALRWLLKKVRVIRPDDCTHIHRVCLFVFTFSMHLF